MTRMMRVLHDRLAKWTRLPADDYLTLTICKKLLFYVGLWPNDTESPGTLTSIKYTLPPFLMAVNLYSGFIGFPMVAILTYGDDLQRCMLASASIFVVFALRAVYVSLVFHQQQGDGMLQSMDEMIACSAKLSERPLEILERNSRFSLVPFGYLMLCMTSLVMGFLDLPGLYLKREFVNDQWYPFDEKAFPAYELVFFFLTISHVGGGTALVSYTTMFMALLVEAIGHFRLLSHNLREIAGARQVQAIQSQSQANLLREVMQPTEAHRVNVGRISATHRTLVGDGISTERRPRQSNDDRLIRRENLRLSASPLVPFEEPEDALKSCLLYHYAILKFVEEVASYFDIFLFLYFLWSLIPTSMAVVFLIYVDEINSKNMTILLLVFGSNLGMVAICWLANLITEQSEEVSEALYDCDWYGQSLSFKKSMLIIMSRTNQPMIVKVGGFIPLSMETFFEMTKLTYTYSMAVWTQYEEVDKSRDQEGFSTVPTM